MFWTEDYCVGHWRISIKKKQIFSGSKTPTDIWRGGKRNWTKVLNNWSLKKERTLCNLKFRWPNHSVYPCQTWPIRGRTITTRELHNKKLLGSKYGIPSFTSSVGTPDLIWSRDLLISSFSYRNNLQTLAKNQRDLYGQFVSLTLLLVMTKSEENKICIKNIKTFLSLLYKKK